MKRIKNQDVLIKMNQEYIQVFPKFKGVEKVVVPKFDPKAYTDIEYANVVKDYLSYDVDDLNVTIDFLKGD